jgi:hypothetical protein
MPSYRSHTLTAGAGTTSPYVATAPPSIVNDDILVALMYIEDPSTAIIPPAGWVQKNEQLSDAVPTEQFRHIVFWKRASGEAGNYSFTWVGGATLGLQVLTAAYSGAFASGDPFDTQSSAENVAAGTTSPALSVTTTVASGLLLFSTGAWFVGTWSNYQPGSLTWTEREDSGNGVILVDADLGAAGTTSGIQATTTTSSQLAAWAGVLEPSGPPTAPAFMNAFLQ